jgi:beta propeller repeat protein
VLFHTTSNTAARPALDDHLVVWQDHRSGTMQIYGYDLQRGDEFPLTDGDCDAFQPSISGTIVVWLTLCPALPGADLYSLPFTPERFHRSIAGYDLARGMAIDLDAGPADAYPQVSGRYVVWLASYAMGWSGCAPPACRGEAGIPFARDLETGEVWQLADQRTVTGFRLTDSSVAWADIGGQWTRYDLNTREKTLLGRFPTTTLVGDQVLGVLGGSDDRTISQHDVQTGITSVLATIPEVGGGEVANTSFAYSPDHDVLVWSHGGQFYQGTLYAYDLATGEMTQVTGPPLAADHPIIAGDLLAWDTIDGLGANSARNIVVARLPRRVSDVASHPN